MDKVELPNYILRYRRKARAKLIAKMLHHWVVGLAIVCLLMIAFLPVAHILNQTWYGYITVLVFQYVVIVSPIYNVYLNDHIVNFYVHWVAVNEACEEYAEARYLETIAEQVKSEEQSWQ